MMNSNPIVPNFKRLLFFLFLWSALLVFGCKHAAPDLRPIENPNRAARQLTRQGKAKEAFEKFQEILADNPEDLTSHRGYVEAAYFSGRLDEVTRHYQGLSKKEGKQAIGHYGLALIAVARGPGHMAKGLDEFKTAMKLKPKEPDFPYRVGLLYLMNGEIGKASTALEKSMKLDERWPASRVAYAHCMLQLGREKEALDVMRPLLNMTPRPEDARKARAIADTIFDLEKNVPPEAIPDLHKATEQMEKESMQQALLGLSDLTVRFPSVALAFLLKGLAHSRMENHAEAIVAIEKSIELRADNPVALVSLGDVYYRLEKWKEARECFMRAIELNPFSVEGHERMGQMAVTREDYDLAVREFDTLVLLDSENMGYRHQRARNLIQTGRLKEAIGAYQDMLERMPNDLETLIRLAQLYMQQAEKEPSARDRYRRQAIEHVRWAHELAPDNEAVQDMLSALEE